MPPPRRKPGPKKRTPEERRATRRPRVPRAAREAIRELQRDSPPTPQVRDVAGSRTVRPGAIMADVAEMIARQRPRSEILATLAATHHLSERQIERYMADVLHEWAEAAKAEPEKWRARTIAMVLAASKRGWEQDDMSVVLAAVDRITKLTGLDQPAPAPAPVLSTAEADARAAILIPRIRQILAERAGATVDVTPRATMDPCPTPPHK